MASPRYTCSLVGGHDTIRLKHGNGVPSKLDITFRRTIRVPDNDHFNYLPPSLGAFPLYKIKDYANKLPAAMVAKGGLFLPMYPMWIQFAADSPFLIKVYCGGVNIISGEHANEDMATTLRRQNLKAENRSLQDYMVVPGQRWIDGIATSPGLVKQFVAMPMGSGYTVEAQLTGKETTGGLQFEITPTIAAALPLANLSAKLPVKPPVTRVVSCPPKPAPSKAITNPSAKESPNSFQLFVRSVSGKTVAVHTSSSSTIESLKSKIEEIEGIPSHHQRLVLGNKQLENACSVGSYNIEKESTLHLVLRLQGGDLMNDGGIESKSTNIKRFEMGIASGGLIKQSIVKDTHSRSAWDAKHTVAFNIQILNSDAFRYVTGFRSPYTPVTAEAYERAGLPFYKLLEESSEVCGTFENVKSIATIDGKREKCRSFPVDDAQTRKRIKSASGSVSSGTATPSTGRTLVNPVVGDPDGIVNPTGPMREFRTIHDLEAQISSLNLASFDS